MMIFVFFSLHCHLSQLSSNYKKWGQAKYKNKNDFEEFNFMAEMLFFLKNAS